MCLSVRACIHLAVGEPARLEPRQPRGDPSPHVPDWLRVNPEDFERWWAEYQPVLAKWDAMLVFESEWETVELIAHTG